MRHFASCKIKKNVKIIVSEACLLTSVTMKVSILKYCQLQHSTGIQLKEIVNDTLITIPWSCRISQRETCLQMTTENGLSLPCLTCREHDSSSSSVVVTRQWSKFYRAKSIQLYSMKHQCNSNAVERYTACSGMLLTTTPPRING